MTTDEEIALDDLAALSQIEYERCRKQSAANLKLEVPSLDRLVKERRKQNTTDTSKNSIVDEIEPWENKVDGKELFNELCETIRRHCIIPEKSETCIALFILFTYLHNSFVICPILAITSASKRCGKTVLLTLISKLCHNKLIASNISPAAVFRSIDAWNVTLLIDEADTFLKDNVELRGIINSGHTKDTAYVVRVEGESHTPAKFSTWCPKVIACIGNLPDTNADRSIEINLKRKKPNEEVEKLYLSQNFEVLQCKCKRWADDHQNKLGASTYLDFLNDRAADNWDPLLSIAEAIGTDAKDLAIQAAKSLSVSEADDDFLGLLIADVLEAFGGDGKLASYDIVKKLNDMEDRPWPEFNRGKELTVAKLARLLKPLKIKPKQARYGHNITRGYYKADFDDVAERYLPKNSNPPASPEQAVTLLQANGDAAYSDNETVTQENNVTLANNRKANGTNGCNGVTLPSSNVQELITKACSGTCTTSTQLADELTEADYEDIRNDELKLEGLRTVAKDLEYRG